MSRSKSKLIPRPLRCTKGDPWRWGASGKTNLIQFSFAKLCIYPFPLLEPSLLNLGESIEFKGESAQALDWAECISHHHRFVISRITNSRYTQAGSKRQVSLGTARMHHRAAVPNSLPHDSADSPDTQIKSPFNYAKGKFFVEVEDSLLKFLLFEIPL